MNVHDGAIRDGHQGVRCTSLRGRMRKGGGRGLSSTQRRPLGLPNTHTSPNHLNEAKKRGKKR
jgi:hypothetical protein